MKYKHIILTFYLLFFNFSGCSKTEKKESYHQVFYRTNEMITISILCNKTNLNVAEILSVDIKAEIEKQHILEFIPSKKIENFNIESVESIPVKLSGKDKLMYQWQLRLSPLLKGNYEFILGELKVKRDESNAVEIANYPAGPVNLDIISVLKENKTNLNDIIELFSLKKPIFFIILILTLIILSILTFVILYKPKSGDKGKTELHIPPAYEALMCLDRLLASDALQKGNFDYFVTELANILRHFVEKQYGIHAPERTTEEFLAEIRNDFRFSAEDKELLKKFLDMSDIVKFAEYIPSKEEIDNLVFFCRSFISSHHKESNKDQTEIDKNRKKDVVYAV